MFRDIYTATRDLINHSRFIRRTPLAIPRIVNGVIQTNLLHKPRLRVVEIAVDFACNGRCIYCSAAKMYNPQKEINKLSVEEYKKLGKTLDKLGVVGIVITGGEPTLRKDLPQVIRALNPKNKIISVVTNSLLVTEEKLRDLKNAGLNALECSLESTDPKQNDEIRGVKGHYQKVMATIRLAKKIGLNVCLSPCLTHQNIRKFEKFIKFAQKLNAFILLSLAGDVGRWSQEENVVLNENDWKIMEDYREKYSFIRNDFSTNFILKEGCPAGREKLYISAYGDVIPCSFTQISFGNIRTEPLEKIWFRMRNFAPYQKFFPYCRRTRDREFASLYLDPIKNENNLPYPINDLLKKLNHKPLD